MEMTDFELTSNSQSNLAIPTNFKSTLPPRKRAKTKEEKEQRRIERILRNRRAAHQSREKKRLHLQYLERKCSLLENLLNCVNLEKLADHEDVLTCSHDAFVASLDEYRDFQSTRGASLDTRASSHSSSDTFTPSPLNCTMEPATLSPKSMRDSASDQETSWELQMFKTENVPESTTLPAVDNNNLFDAVASPLADPLCDDIAGNSLPFDNSIDLDNWRNPASGLNSFELNDFFITS
ncbi:ANL_HP_G0134380.mRNA.1.CDS.1 [Saccharomyces cerevisiae]|nr:ANL_HP_G0011710.mRNA.1.CDS.1 [Saccharomyces cerevisiae]CAI4946419.1 ANL_HP_G0015950.mRNA.1.CDS.1 [Saccharomyces cerevisiae]CAI4955931.1 ANL_HP_G0022380.mRNA.1.CDS.1 [Saccharomyces cerevisiae]CAI5187790.1 ANL_HP_G0134380.mRNA.1.CDS.1 [Saccharomyces cerevisiae]CAI6542595.1 ANL_HP_G0011710.mRNA.1.CDS.1 [Saccharomyces cerevisiae]